ncbi:MAG: DUF748 domain-containing protein [Gammaproteobacteria bacterium]
MNPSRWKRPALITAATVLTCTVLYGLVGYFVIPGILERTLQRQVTDNWGGILHINELHLHPFRFEADMEMLRYEAPDGSFPFTADGVLVNFDPTGLLWRTIMIRKLEFRKPYASLLYHEDGETNLSRLIGADTAKAAGALSLWRVMQLSISEGSLEFIDYGTEQGARIDISRIELMGDDIGTHPEAAGRFRLHGDLAADAEFKLAGNLDMAALTARGRFSLGDFSLAVLSPWVVAHGDWDNPGGQFNIGGNFTGAIADDGPALHLTGVTGTGRDLSLSAENTSVRIKQLGFDLNAKAEARQTAVSLALTDLGLELNELKLQNPESTAGPSVVEKIRLEKGNLHWPEKRIRIAGLTLDGGEISIRRDEQGRLHSSLPIRSPTSSATEGGTSAALWEAKIEKLQAGGMHIEFVDAGLAAPFEYGLSDVALQVSGFNTAPASRTEFRLTLNADYGGRLQAGGSLDAAARSAQMTVRLEELDLSPFAPYLHGSTALKLQSGHLSADLDASIDESGFKAGGTAVGRELSLLEETGGERALTLEQATLNGVSLSGLPLEVSVERLNLDRPYVRMEIDPERRLNVSTWFSLPERTQRQTEEDLEDTTGTNLAIKRVDIQEGRLDFVDHSLSPLLELEMRELAGTVAGLRLGPEHTAVLELKGLVGEFGSADITGRLRPFDPVRDTELDMIIRNLDTTMLSPYTARFAGRRIEAGRMNLTLDYRIREASLEGNHAIEISDFVLGERVESPDAMDLPLDLAVALLKNRDGRINITVPVTGSLVNPDFDIRSVVTKALGNLIKNIVGAPFKALGALVGAADKKLDTVPFEPGSAAITPPAREILEILARAMEQRPALAMRAVGAFDPDRDGDALVRRRLRLQIALATAGGQAGARSDPPPVSFSEPRVQEVLEEFAQARLGKARTASIAAEFESARETAEGNEEKESAAYYEALYEALVENEAIPKTALERLARYRAQSIVDHLVTAGIAPDRAETTDQVKQLNGSGDRIFVELSAVPES